MERSIDSYLFGNDLFEHIKSARELKKVSNDIKTFRFSLKDNIKKYLFGSFKRNLQEGIF